MTGSLVPITSNYLLRNSISKMMSSHLNQVEMPVCIMIMKASFKDSFSRKFTIPIAEPETKQQNQSTQKNIYAQVTYYWS